MRFICICCEAGGADSSGPNGTIGNYSFDCHVCKKKDTMWPHRQATKFLDTVRALREPVGLSEADRRVVSALQEDLNVVKTALREYSERSEATIALGLEIIDSILPQAGKISIDVGAVNEFCMAARK